MKNIFIKIKNHWNYVADPEDLIIFTKEWFIFILCILGVLGVIALLAFLCMIFDADIDGLFDLLKFGGFLFILGIIIGLNRRVK